jgi:hypothetical protein
LTDGAVTLGSFDGAARARLAALAAKASAHATRAYDVAYPARWGARLAVQLAGGETFVAEQPACKGDPEVPVTIKEMRVKAAMLLEHARLPKERGTALIESVIALPEGGTLPDIAQLYA